jgi:hypothetical protein
VKRDPYLDALRAGCLTVVVLWHTLATRLTWAADGPHAGSPLESVPGLWLGTWVLQVMPVFFYVGGCLHARSASRPGYVRRRLAGLARIAAAPLGGAALVGALLAAVGGTAWATGTVTLALSPLWFLAVYVLLVALLPAWLWLHRRYGLGALVGLAGAAVLVDVVRLGVGVDRVGWANLVLVWGLAHQAGFHHERLLRAPRRVGYALVGGGLAALCGLLALGYPGSLVGVPGDKWSNMSPPSVAIVALTAVQVGLIRLAHPAAARWLARPAAAPVLAAANRYGLPVYLFHMTAYLLAQAAGWPAALLVSAGLLAGYGRPRQFRGAQLEELVGVTGAGRRRAPTPAQQQTDDRHRPGRDGEQISRVPGGLATDGEHAGADRLDQAGEDRADDDGRRRGVVADRPRTRTHQ